MGRKSAIRSRKNTHSSSTTTTNRVASVKSGGLERRRGRRSQRSESAASSAAESGDEADAPAAADFDDTHLIDARIDRFVVQQLVFSRVILLSVQCIFNALVADWPTDAFKGVEPAAPSSRDGAVQLLVGGLGRWDARQFLHIGEFGYTWESNLAFFPLFPALLRLSGGAVRVFVGDLSLFNAMILGGVVLNNVLFVVNGVLLFKLCALLTKSTKESMIAVYVYCFNPASVFFSAVYTESLYFFFVLLALNILHGRSTSRKPLAGAARRAKSTVDPFRLLTASFVLSFAFLTRSNGLLNVGYVWWPLCLEILTVRDAAGRLQLDSSFWSVCEKTIKRAALLLACFAIVVLPLRVFGWAMEERFCNSVTLRVDDRLQPLLLNQSNRVLPGDLEHLSWCRPEQPPSFLTPAYYSPIQEKYWDVGLFAYWQWRKLPMFLSALPTLLFVLYATVDLLFDLGMDRRSSLPEMLADTRLLAPFVAHSALIALCGVFVYNVEVSTRMLYSSSPLLYIVLARIMAAQTPRIEVPEDLLVPSVLPFFANYIFVRPLHFAMMSYLLGYFFVGTMLHVNWLPFV
ncbi:GPI mannosyltransferase 2 [Aphelenchoides fujianensis]|nr:GPI mannosyltransferase 2 [Aphelenchoides fujianensis]